MDAKAERKENDARQVWFDGREVSLERQDIWGLINNSPIQKVVVSAEQRRSGHYPLKTELITEIRNIEHLDDITGGDTVLSADQSLLDSAKHRGYKTCIFISVEGRKALEQSWQDALKYDYVLVDFDLPTNIPLELIIARLQSSDTALLKRVTTFSEMEVVFGVLEKGSDGVLFAGTNINEIIKVSEYLAAQDIHNIELYPLTVSSIQNVGMGFRACIDTTGMMTQEEGMIVGSTSHGGILICSETHYLPYMNLRPFRVNAGAIHSYVWMPNDSAEYLSDLAAGSRALCVDTAGKARELTVGRVKIEVRPLLLIKGTAAGKEINVIVQDDWHIRLMGADGQPKNASLIRPGDELLAYVCEPGRHVGIKVNETIIEK